MHPRRSRGSRPGQSLSGHPLVSMSGVSLGLNNSRDPPPCQHLPSPSWLEVQFVQFQMTHRTRPSLHVDGNPFFCLLESVTAQCTSPSTSTLLSQLGPPTIAIQIPSPVCSALLRSSLLCSDVSSLFPSSPCRSNALRRSSFVNPVSPGNGSIGGNGGGGLQSQTHVALQQLLGESASRRTSIEGRVR